jgi:predicted O-linked N-acetylglucosamine transferase (SPINDLY family)
MKKPLKLDPEQFLQHHLERAKTLFLRKQPLPARAALLKVLKAAPDWPPALELMGIISGELGKLEESIRYLARAVAAAPDSVGAHFNLGRALALVGRDEEALASLEAAIRLRPGTVAFLFERATVLAKLQRNEEAEAGYRRVIQIEPRHADAHYNFGRLLSATGRREAALASLGTAIRLRPGTPQFLVRHANVLAKLHRLEEAEAGYREAIRIDARCMEAHHQLGRLHNAKGDIEAAAKSFRLAHRCDPALVDPLVNLIAARMILCDWTEFDTDRETLIALESKEPRLGPWQLMLINDDPELHLSCARGLAGQSVAASERPTPGNRPQRLKIAYVSADFRVHPTAFLAAGLFEKHDRNRFEVVAVSLADDGSDIGRRILDAADVALNVADRDGQEVAHRLRAMGVDIAIDLMGHTTKSNFDIFRSRAAPIQVGFLGYPGTTGSEAVSYLIVDPVIATDEVRRAMSEQPVIMPHCYQCNDDQRPWPQDGPARAQCGLPENAFVYCSFNQTRKITPEVFDLWMRILRNVESSVLWLYVRFDGARANLLREAEKRGVAPERIVFAERLPQTQHLARFRLADLMLDTFPYGAHTTASDALWMGCPVLTRAGRSFASRVGASLLHTVGLPELVTTSFEDYEALAVDLARDPAKIASLRARLAEARTTTPLFDTALFCRYLERAYDLMWERHAAGAGPAMIDLRVGQG